MCIRDSFFTSPLRHRTGNPERHPPQHPIEVIAMLESEVGKVEQHLQRLASPLGFIATCIRKDVPQQRLFAAERRPPQHHRVVRLAAQITPQRQLESLANHVVFQGNGRQARLGGRLSRKRGI